MNGPFLEPGIFFYHSDIIIFGVSHYWNSLRDLFGDVLFGVCVCVHKIENPAVRNQQEPSGAAVRAV